MSKFDDVIAGIEKDMGKGAIMRLGEKQPDPVEVVSTGSLGLDKALGVGGLPKGRIVEIFGPESSGKTTIATHVIAEAQKLGGKCCIIDAEHAFDSQYAAALGVDIDELLISQPDHGEQALEIADRLVNSGAFSVIVIDSVAALVPKAELDGEMGENKIGLQARMMSQALRKMAGAVSKNNCILIFINQLRLKIGVMFGNPEVTTGGESLKFYASVRIDVRRSTTEKNSIMENELKVGNLTTAHVIKNKVAPPFRKAQFDIVYGEGIDKYGELIDISTDRGIVDKKGSWFSYGGSNIAQGRDALKTLLSDNAELYEDIKSKLFPKTLNV